jgi:hypothetical protein
MESDTLEIKLAWEDFVELDDEELESILATLKEATAAA